MPRRDIALGWWRSLQHFSKTHGNVHSAQIHAEVNLRRINLHAAVVDRACRLYQKKRQNLLVALSDLITVRLGFCSSTATGLQYICFFIGFLPVPVLINSFSFTFAWRVPRPRSRVRQLYYTVGLPSHEMSPQVRRGTLPRLASPRFAFHSPAAAAYTAPCHLPARGRPQWEQVNRALCFFFPSLPFLSFPFSQQFPSLPCVGRGGGDRVRRGAGAGPFCGAPDPPAGGPARAAGPGPAAPQAAPRGDEGGTSQRGAFICTHARTHRAPCSCLPPCACHVAPLVRVKCSVRSSLPTRSPPSFWIIGHGL